jgi:glycosyltransferase involved in cell wall biosynthesis
MENQTINRKDLANQIASLFVEDENAAIELWKGNYQNLELPQNEMGDLLSVLTCVYNSEEFIGNALDSIMLQTFSNFELIIVADPCSDRTIEIIKNYQKNHSNIHLIENQERQGFIGSLNIGLGHCNGKYIARMDTDDLIHPMRFEKQINFLEINSSISVVSTWMKIFDERKQTYTVTYRNQYNDHKNTSLFFSPLSHAASMFKSDVLKTLRYREGYMYAEDYDLWTRILKLYQTACLPEYLYYYRTHSNQVTNVNNIEPTKDSLRKIINNFHELFHINSNNINLVEFHLKHLMLNQDLLSKSNFIQWDNYLRQILKGNKHSNYLNEDSFSSFIFINHWQSYFLKFIGQFNLKEIILLKQSPFNKFNILQLTKKVFKSKMSING